MPIGVAIKFIASRKLNDILLNFIKGVLTFCMLFVHFPESYVSVGIKICVFWIAPRPAGGNLLK